MSAQPARSGSRAIDAALGSIATQGKAADHATLRAIDASRFAGQTPPPDFGPACQLQWLPIASLVVDEHYQRPVAPQGERTIRAIIAKFDWRMFAPVVVSPIAGGRYAIVDGQHRTTAALACGVDQVPCAVIMADRQTQATAFGAINGVITKVTALQQFKAALAAEDPGALRVAAVTRSAGIRLVFSNTSMVHMRPGDTMALGAIRRAIELHGEALTALALRCVVASAGDLAGYLRAPIIAAVATVLADRREWSDETKLRDAFEAIDLEDSWRQACAEASFRRGVKSADLLQATIITHLDGHVRKVAA